MRTKKGNQLHSEGKKLPFTARDYRDPASYAGAVAAALRTEAESAGRGAKMIMRWTGASERAVKGWLAGRRMPSGEHLVALLRHSDAVFVTVLRLSGRLELDQLAELEEARRHLAAATVALGRAMARRG